MFSIVKLYHHRRSGEWKLSCQVHLFFPTKARKHRISQVRELVFTGSRFIPWSPHTQRVNLQTRCYSTQHPMPWIISQARLRTLKENAIILYDSNNGEEDVVSLFLGARGTIFLFHNCFSTLFLIVITKFRYLLPFSFNSV